jgi:hypothetical protein
MYYSTAKKEREEQESTRQQIVDWINLGKPGKCLGCSQWLNYCRWWEQNYECERHQTEKLKETLKLFR